MPVEPAPPGSTVATFQRGVLVRVPPAAGRAAVGAFTVVGDIYDCYVRSGVTAALGLPVEDQQQRPDGGLRQRFEHGEICWRSDLGAYAVCSRDRTPGGDRPARTTRSATRRRDVVPFDREYDTDGHVTVHWFRGIVRARRPLLGASTASRPGRSAARSGTRTRTGSAGRRASSACRSTTRPDADVRRDIPELRERGAGLAPGRPPVRGRPDVQLRELSIVSFMLVDENDGPLSGDLDLFVRAVLERADTPGGTGVNILNKRFPKDDDWYDAGDHTFARPFTMELAPVLRGEHEFQVMFAGYDAETFGEDVRMGTVNHGLVHAPWDDDPYNWDVRPAYSVDNLWGFEDPDTEHSQFHFKVTYNMTEIGEPLDDKLPFRQQGFWQLHNFDTRRLDMDQYARTFADVDSSEPWMSFDPAAVRRRGLEALFFLVAYKGIARQRELLRHEPGGDLRAEGPVAVHRAGVPPRSPAGRTATSRGRAGPGARTAA